MAIRKHDAHGPARRSLWLFFHCASVALMLSLYWVPPVAADVLGLEAVNDPLPYVVDANQPVSMLLSRSRYPAEDGHLDAILWIGAGNGDSVDPPSGRLELTLIAEDGSEIWCKMIEPLPGRCLFLSPRFPARLAGKRGT